MIAPPTAANAAPTSRPKLTMFHSPTCYHCGLWKGPYAELLRKRQADVELGYINVDLHGSVPAHLDEIVEETPTFLLEFSDIPGCYPKCTSASFSGTPTAAALEAWMDKQLATWGKGSCPRPAKTKKER